MYVNLIDNAKVDAIAEDNAQIFIYNYGPNTHYKLSGRATEVKEDMGVIDYSLNGKQFRQNKIFISGGFRTLFSELKLRETKGYIWKNINGIKQIPLKNLFLNPEK